MYNDIRPSLPRFLTTSELPILDDLSITLTVYPLLNVLLWSLLLIGFLLYYGVLLVLGVLIMFSMPFREIWNMKMAASQWLMTKWHLNIWIVRAISVLLLPVNFILVSRDIYRPFKCQLDIHKRKVAELIKFCLLLPCLLLPLENPKMIKSDQSYPYAYFHLFITFHMLLRATNARFCSLNDLLYVLLDCFSQ